jgi:hypothetical protein
LVFAAGSGLPANVQPSDLRKYLVGTWRWQTRTPVGTTDVYETTLRPDGMFKEIIIVNGDRAHPAWSTGTWEIRGGNQLAMHPTAWFPMALRAPGGRRSGNVVLGWTFTTVSVIDSNHLRHDGGISTRVR